MNGGKKINIELIFFQKMKGAELVGFVFLQSQKIS